MLIISTDFITACFFILSFINISLRTNFHAKVWLSSNNFSGKPLVGVILALHTGITVFLERATCSQATSLLIIEGLRKRKFAC